MPENMLGTRSNTDFAGNREGGKYEFSTTGHFIGIYDR